MGVNKLLATAMILLLLLPVANAESSTVGYVPNPNFQIEDGDYRETLTFISGLAYAIHRYERDHAGRHIEPSYCLQDTEISSKLVIDLLNEAVKGSVSAEMATELLFIQLSRHFPCEK